MDGALRRLGLGLLLPNQCVSGLPSTQSLSGGTTSYRSLTLPQMSADFTAEQTSASPTITLPHPLPASASAQPHCSLWPCCLLAHSPQSTRVGTDVYLCQGRPVSTRSSRPHSHPRLQQQSLPGCLSSPFFGGPHLVPSPHRLQRLGPGAGACADPGLGPQYQAPGSSLCLLRGVGIWGPTHGSHGCLRAGPVWGLLCLPFAAGTSVASAEPRPSSCSCPPPMHRGPSLSGPVKAAMGTTHCQVPECP